jgi:hypothetical protein
MAGELQPLGVVRLFAGVIARVDTQRGLYIMSDAKVATTCRGGTTLRAFPFLSAAKLPFALARYFQIREFIFDAFAHSHHLPIRLARGMRGGAIRNFFPSVSLAAIFANLARQIKREQGLQSAWLTDREFEIAFNQIEILE